MAFGAANFAALELLNIIWKLLRRFTIATGADARARLPAVCGGSGRRKNAADGAVSLVAFEAVLLLWAAAVRCCFEAASAVRMVGSGEVGCDCG